MSKHMDGLMFVWIVLSILTILVAVLWRWQIDRHRLALVESALTLEPEPVVLFDNQGRIIFKSPGLVFFDRRSARQLAGQFHRPERGSEGRGEVEIDGNRYAYRSKLLEYKPGRFGMAVFLTYRRSVAAN